MYYRIRLLALGLDQQRRVERRTEPDFGLRKGLHVTYMPALGNSLISWHVAIFTVAHVVQTSNPVEFQHEKTVAFKRRFDNAVSWPLWRQTCQLTERTISHNDTLDGLHLGRWCSLSLRRNVHGEGRTSTCASLFRFSLWAAMLLLFRLSLP